MNLIQLRRILGELEPGMTMCLPKDWISLNIDGDDETQRDLKTIELATEHGCTWQHDPEAKELSFKKEPLMSQS